jgi:hypothetical protein
MQTKLTRNDALACASFLKEATLAIAALLICLVNLNAQKGKKYADPNLPAYGQVEKADLEMKECDFDDKAEAMVLVDDGVMEFVDGFDLKRRVRIKILNNKGLDWANVRISFYNIAGGMNYISDIEAQTYNLDASGAVVTTKLDKKLIYEKKLNKRVSEKVFSFPDAKVGSIIEYKYTNHNAGLVDWYFQRSIPVRYSRFILDFPNEVEVKAVPVCSHQYQKLNNNSSTRTMDIYTMSKVPAFRDEPYIINEDFYRDRLETKVVAYNFNGRRTSRVLNWVQVIKFLMEDEDFGVQIKKNIPRTADLDEKLKTISSPYEKMKVIYKYVQSNMQWNEYTGIWALDGVKSAWKDKKGTTGEINLILVNLLKEAGLSVHPILVSTHNHGVVNSTDAGTVGYPGYRQFNKVAAYVEIDGTPYVLDATQKDTPVHLIPADILMTEGLVIEKYETFDWGWKTMWKNNASAKSTIWIKGAIDAAAKMSGEATITSYDYARLARIESAKAGKEKYIQKYVSDASNGLAIEGIEFANLESDSLPLVQKIKFNQTLNAAGDYKYFSINLLTGLEKNPFVADNRAADVFFGYNQNFEISGTFTLPDGFQFDELPKNIKMIMPDTSVVISRLSQVYENMLQTRIQIEFKKPVFTAAEYPDLQEFYHRLFDLLNEQFVVRKKS